MAAIDLAVRATLEKWWHAHKGNIASWDDFKRLMAIRFSIDKERFQHKYTGESDPGHKLIFMNRIGRTFQRMNGFTYSFTL